MEEFCNYWLGATVLKVLTESKAHEVARGKWVDPFATSRPVGSGGGPNAAQKEENTEALQILQYIAGDDVEEPDMKDNDIATGEGGEDEKQVPVGAGAAVSGDEMLDANEEMFGADDGMFDADDEMCDADELRPITQTSIPTHHPPPNRIDYKSRGDDHILSLPIHFPLIHFSPTPSPRTSTDDIHQNLDASVQAGAAEDAATQAVVDP